MMPAPRRAAPRGGGAAGEDASDRLLAAQHRRDREEGHLFTQDARAQIAGAAFEMVV
jgi:hypothetical protein